MTMRYDNEGDTTAVIVAGSSSQPNCIKVIYLLTARFHFDHHQNQC
jgi:hypothetical protein